MTGNVKVTMKKKMGICIWVGCMILIVAALCLCLMAVGRDSVYIDGTFVQLRGQRGGVFETGGTDGEGSIMTQTVYLKLSQITQVHEKNVPLASLGEVYCSEKSVESRCRAMIVKRIPRRRETARKPSGWKRHGDYPAD